MFSALQLNAGNLTKFLGAIGTFATVTGPLVAGNVPILTATGIADSGVQLLTTLPGNSLWGNNADVTAPPAALTALTMGAGTKAAATYSFFGSVGSGMYLSAANELAFSAGGELGLKIRSLSATSFFEIISSTGMLLRVQGGTNVDARLASLGLGEVSLSSNGGSTNNLMFRATPSGLVGSANNYLRVTTGQTGANPVLAPVAQASGDTNIGIDFTPVGTGVIRNTTTFFHSRSAVSVVAGVATQAFIKASATADFGLYYGTGNPAFAAAINSLYVKTDASTSVTRLWANTDGSTAWDFFTAGYPALTNVPPVDLSGNVALNNTANYFNGPNTGSIGASGQVWLVFANFVFSQPGTGPDYYLGHIWNGAAIVGSEQTITSNGANINTAGSCFAIVTLSAATTFTLRAKDATSNTGILLDSGTSIGAVRIA